MYLVYDELEFETAEQVLEYFGEARKKLETRYHRERASLQRRHEDMLRELKLDHAQNLSDWAVAREAELDKFPGATIST